MDIEYNKTYKFNITASFGDLNEEETNNLFKDGRCSSHFIEKQLEHWFPELTFVNQKGYDHISKKTNRSFDVKCFTKRGATYSPSKMLGIGRNIDIEVVYAHAKNIDYIICDITTFPNIQIKFISGENLIKKYPSTKIPFKDKKNFFC